MDNDFIVINGLVDVLKMDDSFILDVKYARKDNFIGKPIYNKEKFILRLETARKIIAANNEFKRMGYRLRIYDGYRPLSVQKIMWDILPDEDFVAPITRGSVHNRGAAVDCTLAYINGDQVEMPSEFDDFSEKARIDYEDVSEEAKRNRELLAEVMVKNGFSRIESEWWHFADVDFRDYPIQDIEFEVF